MRRMIKYVTVAVGVLTPVVAAAEDRPHLTVAINQLPDTLEALETMGNVGVRITYVMFDTLIRRDFLADGTGTSAELVPGLAESWERIDDRTMEFTLREGVMFHNGDELTTDDIVVSFSAGRGHGYNPAIGAEAATYMGLVSHVIPIDRYTFQIVMDEPDVLMEQRFAAYAFWPINAREYMTVGKDAYSRNPVGTGPFKFDEWVDGEFLRLVAHDDYFGGEPTAASVTYVVVPEVSARIAGLVSGEYDIAVNIPPDQISTIESYDDLKVERIVLDNTHVLRFHPAGPLEDARVRRALSLSIDRDLLREALWGGANYTPNGHQLPSYELYIENYPEYSYDPDQARALLEEAGYEGEEIVYRIPLNYYLLNLEASQAMQQMWQKVGLNVTLEPRENFTQVREPGMHIEPWSNTHRFPDPLGSFVPQWGVKSGVQNNTAYPERAWQAPERFNELQQVLISSTDQDERREAYREALEIWDEEAVGTLLYNPLETYAMRADVNWKPYGLYYMDFRPYNLSFGDQAAQ